MPSACSIRIRGVVQGVGFRPFVYRLARASSLAGWVLNGEEGVEIFVEGDQTALDTFEHRLRSELPPAASISEMDIQSANPLGLDQFVIRESQRREHPTVRISPDLPVCEACLTELFEPRDRRHLYPYINCTNCGPRYTVILDLPYDRPYTTMNRWPMDEFCSAEYHDPSNRRFQAQPVACPQCGPRYFLRVDGQSFNDDVLQRAVTLLKDGKILAIKGLGGYHLACDARNAHAVSAIRERKYRKEKPFAVMARDVECARKLVDLCPEAEQLLTSVPRPIVLAPAKLQFPGVAPDNTELGVMLPYTPMQHLLFAAGAPEILVMTSANRSSEPIAYDDDDAIQSLAAIADAFLIGARPIARRVDDSVVRVGTFGPIVLRRARGFAPSAVATLPTQRPILAVGADLKNSITLVVDGQAFVSQHIGDLDHYQAYRAFEETIRDLTSMYEVNPEDLIIVHDAHPEYASTKYAKKINAIAPVSIQHHRAHVASVLAERGEWDKTILGISFDGTGYGDDGSIWGGEFFVGNVRNGFERVAHLRSAALPGGDAAAHLPVQAAAGFLSQVENLPDLTAAPFQFPARYHAAMELVHKQVRTFATTSIGRLFDSAAALLGFTREMTFEGQAAMWLEQLARTSHSVAAYPLPFINDELDFRPLLFAVAEDRHRGRATNEIARAFQAGVARGVAEAAKDICGNRGLSTIVLSGGVFQNELLLEDLKPLLLTQSLEVWTNHSVPPNDGGISLGQAALATFQIRK